MYPNQCLKREKKKSPFRIIFVFQISTMTALLLLEELLSLQLDVVLLLLWFVQ